MAFDPVFTRDVVFPLATAAYAAMDGGSATLPAGFIRTALVQADEVAVAAMTNPHPAVAAMTKNTNIFGLAGRNAGTRTAFISFRGSQDLADWLQDLDACSPQRPTSMLGLRSPSTAADPST
jgi:triacylglycerol lipase